MQYQFLDWVWLPILQSLVFVKWQMHQWKIKSINGTYLFMYLFFIYLFHDLGKDESISIDSSQSVAVPKLGILDVEGQGALLILWP